MIQISLCNGSADEFSTSTSRLSASQGLYALLLMRVGVGARSLSARSFKVRHGMHRCGEIRSEYVPRCQSMVRTGASKDRHVRLRRCEGSDKAETNKDRIYMITSE